MFLYSLYIFNLKITHCWIVYTFENKIFKSKKKKKENNFPLSYIRNNPVSHSFQEQTILDNFLFKLHSRYITVERKITLTIIEKTTDIDVIPTILVQ